MKVIGNYRGTHFMNDTEFESIISMIKEEIEACKDDSDCQCAGFFVLAEANRQRERWDDAIMYGATCESYEAKLSDNCRKCGFVQFAILAAATAHHACDNPVKALEELDKIHALGSDHFFAKQVDFKATELRRLSEEFVESSYSELVIQARCDASLIVDVPAGTEKVSWDWKLDEFTISFTATWSAEGGKHGKEKKVQEVSEHSSTSGLLLGQFEPKGPGQLKLSFDNKFSMFRSKKVSFRVFPDTLEVNEA